VPRLARVGARRRLRVLVGSYADGGRMARRAAAPAEHLRPRVDRRCRTAGTCSDAWCRRHDMLLV